MQYDVAIIGGGILGLAHAWMASRRGQSVLLCERTASPQGASVRNFGMIWPVGQPAGEYHAIAMRSRELWLELHAAQVVDVQACGSLHLAHHADELAVLEEFCNLGSHQVSMLTPNEVRQRAPLANPQGLRGGMLSDTELRVNPRVASAQIAHWLQHQHRVDCQFNTQVTRVQDRVITASDGRHWTAGHIVICSGSDLQTLFPERFRQSGLKLCKLQMLKAVEQPVAFRQAIHLASGLTLRHYQSFRSCPTLASLQARIAREAPELDRYGIHVMLSQLPNGEVILGDSHEYDADIEPFDKQEIDELIIRECQTVFQLSTWTTNERWHGIYAKHPQLPVFEDSVDANVHLFVGTGGAGMTMAFGLAERAWQRWTGTNA